jgi:hypothetical protein
MWKLEFIYSIIIKKPLGYVKTLLGILYLWSEQKKRGGFFQGEGCKQGKDRAPKTRKSE